MRSDHRKKPWKLTATPLCLFAGILAWTEHMPKAWEQQPCQLSLPWMVPVGRGRTQTHPSSAARQRPGSDSASSQAALLHQTRSHAIWGPDRPLPFRAPLSYLPRLLGGQQAERGVHVARLLPHAHCLLGRQGRFGLPKAELERNRLLQTRDLLQVKSSSGPTHPKPDTTSISSPVCRLQLILQSKAFVP